MNDPSYRNWIPRRMLAAILLSSAVCAFLGVALARKGFRFPALCLLVLFLAGLFLYVYYFRLALAFSYESPDGIPRRIVEHIARHLGEIPSGRILDVGCGSGALSIAIAKHNPHAQVVGVDLWKGVYASYSRGLCQENSKAEGVKNTSFQYGDARKLPFPDGTFDAVASNYVYHNIAGSDRKALLLETLRVLKKGGRFALHDVMAPRIYGDMDAFVDRLKAMGYREVHLEPTAEGSVMQTEEAKAVLLSDSKLLWGVK